MIRIPVNTMTNDLSLGLPRQHWKSWVCEQRVSTMDLSNLKVPSPQGSSMSQTYCMVKGHWIDDHKVLQVVLVGGVIPMPSHNVEWGDILINKKKKQERVILAHNAFIAMIPQFVLDITASFLIWFCLHNLTIPSFGRNITLNHPMVASLSLKLSSLSHWPYSSVPKLQLPLITCAAEAQPSSAFSTILMQWWESVDASNSLTIWATVWVSSAEGRHWLWLLSR